MPTLSRWFVRTALVYFVAALITGVALMLRPVLNLPPEVAALQPVYFHLLMVGWVSQLIFGHAPIILPGVMNVATNYSPAFYAHLALLHTSLILRVTGDLAFADPFNPVRRWGGMLNVIALLVFLANTVRSARRAPQGSLTTAH